jgi:hypothetical protein
VPDNKEIKILNSQRETRERERSVRENEKAKEKIQRHTGRDIPKDTNRR